MINITGLLTLSLFVEYSGSAIITQILSADHTLDFFLNKNALEKRDSHFHTEKSRIEYLGAHILRSKKESNPDKDKVKWWSTISHELWVL